MPIRDLKIDSDFTLSRYKNSSYQSVSGRDEFEQSVMIALQNRLEKINEFSSNGSTEQKLRLAINRTARENNRLEQIQRTTISEKDGEPNTLQVEIVYLTGETFSDTLNT
jgi:uncharacterized protein YpmB